MHIANKCPPYQFDIVFTVMSHDPKGGGGGGGGGGVGSHPDFFVKLDFEIAVD